MTGLRLVALVLSMGFLAVAPVIATDAASGDFKIQREPVVNIDVTGSGLAGPMHNRFTVYNDGGVTYSDAFDATATSRAGTLTIPLSEVAQLRRDLVKAGALTLEDQQLLVADIPLTTVTVLRGGTNARARTFSYWAALDDYAAIGQVINEFRNRHIPGN